MTLDVSAPGAGSVKFLKRLHTDFRDGLTPAGPTARGRKTLEAHLPPAMLESLRRVGELGDPSAIRQVLAEQFESLSLIAERQRRLERELESRISESDTTIPHHLIEQLEDCVEQQAHIRRVAEMGLERLALAPQAEFETAVVSAAAAPVVLPTNIDIQLVHEDHTPATPRPLLHRRVEVYAQKWYGAQQVAYEMTDREGQFRFPYVLGEELNLRVYEELLPHLGLISRIGKAVRMVFSCDFTTMPTSTEIKVNLYEYPIRDVDYLPRLRQPDDASLRPQQESLSYQSELLKAGAGPLIKDRVAKFIHTVQGIESLRISRCRGKRKIF